MAATCYSSGYFSSSSSSCWFSIQKSGSIIKPVSKLWMLKPRKLTVKKTLTLQIKSSMKNKVFEDNAEGIICYTDENGEMICEGFDEGPRFHQDVPKTINHQKRDMEIVDLLLKQTSLQIVKEGELSHVDVGVNGFDSFYQSI